MPSEDEQSSQFSNIESKDMTSNFRSSVLDSHGKQSFLISNKPLNREQQIFRNNTNIDAKETTE